MLPVPPKFLATQEQIDCVTSVMEANLSTGTGDEVPKKKYVLQPAKPSHGIPPNATVQIADPLGNHQVGNAYKSSTIGGRNKIDTAKDLKQDKERKVRGKAALTNLEDETDDRDRNIVPANEGIVVDASGEVIAKL